jgi:4-amino-4-deoxy-L-arabinose transferase-like glycosyltransferase
VRSVPVTEYGWLTATLLLSLALRVPFFEVAMIADEGGYAYATRGWLNGTGQLYGDLWISRPQGIFLVYAGIFETLGTGTVAFRFAAWIACALTTIVVWLIARRWVSPRIALFAAACFAFFSSLPNIEGFTANAEIFMGLPAAIAAWLILRAHERQWPRSYLIAIGIMIGLATQLKPSGIVMILVTWAFLLLIEPLPLRSFLQRCGWTMVGLAVIGIPSLIHGFILGWDDFLYATITYRLTSQSSATTSLNAHLHGIANLTVRCYGLVIAVVVVLILHFRHPLRRAWFGLAWRWQNPALSRSSGASGLHAVVPGTVRGPLSRPADEVGFLLRIWTIGCVLGISMGGDWWPHYLIQVAAPFSIWFAKTAVDLWRQLRRWDRLLFAVTVVGMLMTPYWVMFSGDRDARSITDALFGHAGYPAQEEIARYLHDHTEPGDTIYVAFDQAAIYYLADRPPAYRHLYDQELIALPNSYSEILSIIQGPDRPKYIVTTRQTGPFPDDGRAFWQVVSNYYEFETDINGVPILRVKQDPPATPPA